MIAEMYSFFSKILWLLTEFHLRSVLRSEQCPVFRLCFLVEAERFPNAGREMELEKMFMSECRTKLFEVSDGLVILRKIYFSILIGISCL
jgi:hypothetical protein